MKNKIIAKAFKILGILGVLSFIFGLGYLALYFHWYMDMPLPLLFIIYGVIAIGIVNVAYSNEKGKDNE